MHSFYAKFWGYKVFMIYLRGYTEGVICGGSNVHTTIYILFIYCISVKQSAKDIAINVALDHERRVFQSIIRNNYFSKYFLYKQNL